MLLHKITTSTILSLMRKMVQRRPLLCRMLQWSLVKMVYCQLQAIAICLQDGQLVKECVADDNGNAIVNLGDMPKGIIILQSNIENIKIINR